MRLYTMFMMENGNNQKTKKNAENRFAGNQKVPTKKNEESKNSSDWLGVLFSEAIYQAQRCLTLVWFRLESVYWKLWKLMSIFFLMEKNNNSGIILWLQIMSNQETNKGNYAQIVIATQNFLVTPKSIYSPLSTLKVRNYHE